MIKEGEDLEIVLKSLVAISLEYCDIYDLSGVEARLQEQRCNTLNRLEFVL